MRTSAKTPTKAMGCKLLSTHDAKTEILVRSGLREELMRQAPLPAFLKRRFETLNSSISLLIDRNVLTTKTKQEIRRCKAHHTTIVFLEERNDLYYWPLHQ
jgi:hypothetical protein